MKQKPHAYLAVAALSVELAGGAALPTEFRYLPYGRFRAADGSGRPTEVAAGWLLTHERAVAIASAFNARRDARVIDYEHQTLHAEKNGQPAPAAGWIGGLDARDDGLYAIGVEWTAQAAKRITDKEYRYVSPVFAYDKRSGEVIAAAHAALTNYAGLDGLTDLAGSAAALSALFHDEQEMPMKALLAALGLSETATEAEALAALNALKATHDGQLAALKGATPDPTKYVELATLTAVRGELATKTDELAALKAASQKAEIDTVITEALAAGKITPATEPHARKLAALGLAELKAFIADQPAVIQGGTQTNGKGGAGGSHQSTDTDVAVMKALGLTAEQFATGKAEV